MQQLLIGKQTLNTMIQNEKIIGLMKGTLPYTNKTLPGLSELLEEYPYFQAAHLLRTLNLLQLKDTHFLFDLRKTAIYLPDRKQLLFLTENTSFAPELMEIMETMETIEKETIQKESNFDLIDTFLSDEDIEETELDDVDFEEPPVVPLEYTAYTLSDETGNDEAPPLEHQDIIDKFLEKDAASPMKIKLDKPEKTEKELPEPELDEQSEEQPVSVSFFSETLAKIYIKQKKYNKALEIINKLNLLYPKKSRYFADQIRFLEKLINNTNKIK